LKKLYKPKLKIDRSDVFFYAGGLTICGGVGMIYLPVAVILLGVLFIIIALSETKPSRGG
jgi:hypothetical protein